MMKKPLGKKQEEYGESSGILERTTYYILKEGNMVLAKDEDLPAQPTAALPQRDCVLCGRPTDLVVCRHCRDNDPDIQKAIREERERASIPEEPECHCPSFVDEGYLLTRGHKPECPFHRPECDEAAGHTELRDHLEQVAENLKRGVEAYEAWAEKVASHLLRLP